MDETKQKPNNEDEPQRSLVARGKPVYDADGKVKEIQITPGGLIELFPVYPFRQRQTDARCPITTNYGTVFNEYVELRKQRSLTEKECEDFQKSANQIDSQIRLTKDELDIIWCAIGSYKCVDIKAFLTQKCNISDPTNLSWAEIISHLKVWMCSQTDLSNSEPTETDSQQKKIGFLSEITPDDRRNEQRKPMNEKRNHR